VTCNVVSCNSPKTYVVSTIDSIDGNNVQELASTAGAVESVTNTVQVLASTGGIVDMNTMPEMVSTAGVDDTNTVVYGCGADNDVEEETYAIPTMVWVPVIAVATCVSIVLIDVFVRTRHAIRRSIKACCRSLRDVTHMPIGLREVSEIGWIVVSLSTISHVDIPDACMQSCSPFCVGSRRCECQNSRPGSRAPDRMKPTLVRST
jgi:hypothetical protein